MNVMKSLWARFWLRKASFMSKYYSIRWLYALKDPWNLSSTKEQTRFVETNDRIRILAPDCRSLLEVGCGEGLQTAWLTKVSSEVSGIDVSAAAVRRARRFCPTADLRVGKAENIGEHFIGRRFDLVTACEVLYYSNDISRVINEMQKIGDCVLVTSFAERMQSMRPYFAEPGWTRLADIIAEGTTWECYAWRQP